jgi:hypothetical protein
MKNCICVIICLFFLLTGFSCQNDSRKGVFASVKNEPPVNTIEELYLHAFMLEPIESSYVGDLLLSNNHIYFVDTKFCWVFQFDTSGVFRERFLGQGSGPVEIATGRIEGYAYLANDYTFYVGAGNDCYLFDENFNIKNSFIINKGNKENPSYDASWIYTLCYQNLIMRSYKDYLYYTIVSEYPSYNFIDSPKDYFQEAHILSKLNLTTGVVERVIGNYPDIYLKNKSLKQLSLVNFDIDHTGNFYISYEGDSLIYVFDEQFLPLTTYGYSGKRMEDKPKVFNTFDTFRKGYAQNRQERGYYTGIDYIDDTKTLFRTYRRGNDNVSDGLQIYKDGMLIGDIDVPAGFKILGYIAPYYYASKGIDEDNEAITIFRFTI